jgi:hypothetical protein
MQCTECEHLMLGKGGVPPSPGQAADYAAHLADCAACRRLHADLAAVFKTWKSDTEQIAVPDAVAAWRQLRPALQSPPARVRHRLAPLFWIGAPLAAAAALALVIYRPALPSASEAAMPVRAEFVEAGNPSASTMVYVDKTSGWLVVWAADTSNNGKG